MFQIPMHHVTQQYPEERYVNMLMNNNEVIYI